MNIDSVHVRVCMYLCESVQFLITFLSKYLPFFHLHCIKPNLLETFIDIKKVNVVVKSQCISFFMLTHTHARGLGGCGVTSNSIIDSL